jgi:hypothetical protein
MKQFTKINESEVACSEGFRVKFTHNKLTYKEGKRAISIDVEHEVAPYKLVVFTGTLRDWHPPFSLETVSKENKVQIMERIESALRFLGIDFELV